MPNVIGAVWWARDVTIAATTGDVHSLRFRKEAPGPELLIAIRNAVLSYAANADLVVLLGQKSDHSTAEADRDTDGVVKVALFEHQHPMLVVHLRTLTLFATGSGLSDARDVKANALRYLGKYDPTDERHDEDWKDVHGIYAVWLREYGLQMLGAPTVALPGSHVRALRVNE